ncbi:MAG TPA: hypothetical protein VHL53_08730 [Acidimicrobiia bacterium]|nr:hypothetical protein [Acidimicrobiia bacterium]
MARHGGLAHPQHLVGGNEETEVVRRYLEALETRRRELETHVWLDQPGTGDVVELEEAFVAVAARYGHREHLSYAAWRAAGVAPDVLHQAGITQAS